MGVFFWKHVLLIFEKKSSQLIFESLYRISTKIGHGSQLCLLRSTGLCCFLCALWSFFFLLVQRMLLEATIATQRALKLLESIFAKPCITEQNCILDTFSLSLPSPTRTQQCFWHKGQFFKFAGYKIHPPTRHHRETAETSCKGGSTAAWNLISY